jgi:hypothetical protein
MILGEFNTGDLGTKKVWAAYIVFILATLFIMIILLNLLIAIMGDTYAEVKETQYQ